MIAKRIVLCADDYGLSPGVSRGILELLARGRLSAVSCMVVFPEFAEDGAFLRPFVGLADIGLHFTLTGKRSLASVATEMHLHAPPVANIAAELERQIDRFREVTGRLPEYIDGHQHVHLLPVVRDAVVHAAGRIGAWVRLTAEPIDASMWGRPALLQSAYLARASRGLARLAARSGLATNRGFRGVRSFRERAPFRTLFRRMIADARDGTIVMCHPGHPDLLLGNRDPVGAARAAELDYFAGPDFPQDMAGARLVLSRFRDAVTPRAAAA
jgi:predicted glycoside hydrolase/deacetylase ChbG (UPF0249 family)